VLLRALALLGLLAACGIKGPPRPPTQAAPEPADAGCCGAAR